MARAVLFDYGGTLDGEGWHWFDRMLALYRRAGCELADVEIKRAFYAADHAIAEEAKLGSYGLRPLVERHVELQMEALGPAAHRFAHEVTEGFCAMTAEGWERSRALLSRLRGRARLGVVSNFYGNLEVLLEEAGLASVLDTVVESARVGVEKPDPAIYRLAAGRLGLPPREVVMIGDSFERDVRPSHSAGMRAIWLRRGDAEPPERGIADCIVSRLSEIDPVRDLELSR